jgi:predicted O-methyltransferase YrrM
MTYKTPGIDGWMSPDELQWLFETASQMNTIIEVGSWLGRSTHALCSGCPGTVYAVDHWRGSETERDGNHQLVKTADVYELFRDNMKEFPLSKLLSLKMDSLNAVQFFSKGIYGPIEMVFIDGGHQKEEVAADLKAWAPIAKKLLCGHDFTQDGVESAVREFGLPFERIPATTIWACWKGVQS